MSEKSGYVQWGEVKTGNGGTEFLQLKSGVTKTVRPIMKLIHFQKFFHKPEGGKLRTAVVSDEVSAQMMVNHPELKKPANRFVIYVIDREDEKVRIMEFPVTVYKAFSDRFEATGKNPAGGAEDGDYRIKVSGSGMTTSYTTTFLDNSPLTEKEKELIKEELGGDKEKLLKIYKFNTVEEAEKKLFSSEEEEGSSNSFSDNSEKSETTPAPASNDAGTNVDGDDLGW